MAHPDQERFSLAWRQLIFEKRRLAAALAGIIFAVVLILVQIGFYSAMNDSATKVLRHLNAQIVIIPAGFEFFGSMHDFARVRLMQTAGITGVKEVLPLYYSFCSFKNINTGYQRWIFCMGIEPGRHMFTLPDVIAQENKLAITGDILFDKKSLGSYFGNVVDRFNRDGPFAVTVQGRNVTIDGFFNLGVTFSAFGNLLMGVQTFFALFPNASPGLVNVGLVRLKKGVDPLIMRRKISRILDGKDIKVLTRAEFVQHEIDYWNKTAAIGFLFIVGAIMGLIIGAVIVYQILYTNVINHLPEFATLKSMGYSDRFFSGLVLKQSLILSVLGFIPGTLLSWVIYHYTAAATGYTMILSLDKAVIAFTSTTTMCVLAGLLAMRQLRKADPAELFR